MKSTTRARSARMEADGRPRAGGFGLAVMVLSLLMVAACGGTAVQSRGNSGDMETRVQDYDNMVKEYERQNGPPKDDFWREVYKDSD